MTLTMKCQLLQPPWWLAILSWTLRLPGYSLKLGSAPETVCAVRHALTHTSMEANMFKRSEEMEQSPGDGRSGEYAAHGCFPECTAHRSDLSAALPKPCCFTRVATSRTPTQQARNDVHVVVGKFRNAQDRRWRGARLQCDPCMRDLGYQSGGSKPK